MKTKTLGDYSEELLRVLNKTRSNPVGAIETYIMIGLCNKTNMISIAFDIMMYPKTFRSDESNFLKVTIDKWMYQFRSPRGQIREWIFIDVSEI